MANQVSFQSGRPRARRVGLEHYIANLDQNSWTSMALAFPFKWQSNQSTGASNGMPCSSHNRRCSARSVSKLCLMVLMPRIRAGLEV